MNKFNCPSCGAEAVFQSNVSVYAVCAYCSSMIVRRDIDVESIGTMAALPEDMSPLMIGTTGKVNNTQFRLVGRMKIGWQDGAWNEWFMVNNNGGKGWLAEAQGAYAVCHEYTQPLFADTQKTLDKYFPRNNLALDADGIKQSLLGTFLFIDQLKYKVVDIKAAVCLGSEGELPFIAPQNRKTLSIDLLGYHGEFGNIEIAADKRRIYLGSYEEFNNLHLQGLRELQGWPTPMAM